MFYKLVLSTLELETTYFNLERSAKWKAEGHVLSPVVPCLSENVT